MNSQQIGTLRDVADTLIDQDGRQTSRFRKVFRHGQDIVAKAQGDPALEYLGRELMRIGEEGELDEQGDVEWHRKLHAIVEAVAEQARRKTA